jgi:alpha-1,3/alpha-1,6-mannosyltransferase
MLHFTMQIAFIHPDLGLGGAERLIVDAATELASRRHRVDVFTAYFDQKRCFEECKPSLHQPLTTLGGFRIIVAGSWFPRHIMGRMIALCAYIRCILAAIYLSWLSWLSPPRDDCNRGPFYDVIIVDQVSAVIPFLRLLLPSTKVLFYCHFPDLLLAQGRSSSVLKRLYRAPLDSLEEWTTGQAHLILVNSKYTQGIFDQTFKSLAGAGIVPKVLYPAVSIPSDDHIRDGEESWRKELPQDLVTFILTGSQSGLGKGKKRLAQPPHVLLSINRFERKKGIGLAIQALSRLSLDPQAVLIIAGGYDIRLAENREHLEELRALAASLGVEDRVWFLPSFTDRQRLLLLSACDIVLYTPTGEHFGIVPLEAMAMSRPVVACSSGGPLESITQGETGMLCRPDADDWASAIEHMLGPAAVKGSRKQGIVCEEMGSSARQHVTEGFSRETFGQRLESFVLDLAAAGGRGQAGVKGRKSVKS